MTRFARMKFCNSELANQIRSQQKKRKISKIQKCADLAEAENERRNNNEDRDFEKKNLLTSSKIHHHSQENFPTLNVKKTFEKKSEHTNKEKQQPTKIQADRKRSSEKFLEFLQQISNDPNGQTLSGAKSIVLVNSGKLSQYNAGKIVKMWKGQQQSEMCDQANAHLLKKSKPIKKHNEKTKKTSIESAHSMEKVAKKLDMDFVSMTEKAQTIDNVKKLVSSYVESGRIGRKNAGIVVKKWKMREKRRLHRGAKKEQNAVCFNCRQFDHQFSECPTANSGEIGPGICFKCGSTEHTSFKCLRKNVKGYPYAVCFVCKKQGHLSRDCDENPNGIYPNGGSCNLCGSQKHLKKNCPNLSNIVEKAPPTLKTAFSAGGDDDNGIFEELNDVEIVPKTVRIVKF